MRIVVLLLIVAVVIGVIWMRARRTRGRISTYAERSYAHELAG